MATRAHTCISALAFTLLVASACLAPIITCAQFPASLPVTSDMKAFAAQYVAAINAKDSAKLWSYLTPETRACVTRQNKDVYDAVFGSQMDNTIPPDYHVTLWPVNQDNAKAMADRSYFPVRPVHELHIDFQLGNDANGIVLWLVRQNGRWFADQPCATEKFIAEFRADPPDREKFKQTAAQIKDPLRAELLAALARHDTPTAIDRYKTATNCDTRTAMLVINALKLSTIPPPPPIPAPAGE